ncbi:O-methyltransferase [Amycolatopsis mediterranei S699]|uniref:S-adenosyl-L-methionine-dependent methyltransferase n=2 Tax=Amycolatopsis mediterranei TaxID=33910 RepID=A0A0H3DBQ8_AMYMU|nr:SAM-dependent methyltransferase [Amycolatopsis mediterranei]ADJ47503.1 putative O-methyltransferase [Amycolatopsis mediterranei U32]AEK44355.1 O-methyltransferase [Amycolatopsis mediterranei S699]AFO79214.1 O-methyltransferase [Amycolatopsis mediterranei S699]AGT86342.1 O-methyltransferase [Amycolatopsis mediterranei RB]KDO12570.1 methyltransferase [Amycolatopsis mediterranei]
MPQGADRTALGPMVIVAADQHEHSPLIIDDIAREILPRTGRLVIAWRPLRKALYSATEKKMPGLWASMLCRKRFIDDKLLAAVERGVGAVVILGAGFDTRAYRLSALHGIPVYEVDLPANIARKEAALRKAFGRLPESVTLVPVDFETQDLAEELAEHGYRSAQRTFFIWEAVTQYLTETAVRRTLDVLSAAPPGSGLTFTYIRQDFLDGTTSYGAQAAHDEFVVKRRLWHFGLHPGEVAAFLAGYGWREVEQCGPAEFTDRYLRPSGRALPVSEVERSVYAERR